MEKLQSSLNKARNSRCERVFCAISRGGIRKITGFELKDGGNLEPK